MPQRENACAAFALACLLRGLGFESWRTHEIDQDLIAYVAGMVALRDDYPLDGDPGTALQARWGFVRQYAYPLRRSAEPALAGTSPEGLVAALETVTEGAWTAIPIAGRRGDGTPAEAADVWAVIDVVLAPENAAWQAQVLFNYQTAHLAALTGPGQGWAHALFGEETRPCEWDVGHVTSLGGVVAGKGGERAVLIRDSSPAFGWRGYHAESGNAVARALARSDGSAGGMLVICRRVDQAQVADALACASPGLAFHLWDNGSRYLAPEGGV